MAASGPARAGRDTVGGGCTGERGSFPITEACLLVAVDLVEEAVLEGGGEAAAGLLRAFRTSREIYVCGGVADGESDSGGRAGERAVTLAGGGRGLVEGAAMCALVELLDEVRRGKSHRGE